MARANEGQTPQNVLLFLKDGTDYRPVTVSDMAGGGGGGNPSGDGAVNTGTQSNVAASASSVTILAANTARYGATIWNDSSVVLYLLVGTGTASTTVCTVKIPADGYYEVPYGYTGIISGIWPSATGSARVTQYT